MNEEINEAIGLINKFLEENISKYKCSEINFDLYSNRGFNPTFTIKLPTSINSKELISISDTLFEDVCSFAESKNIEFILEDLSIIVGR